MHLKISVCFAALLTIAGGNANILGSVRRMCRLSPLHLFNNTGGKYYIFECNGELKLSKNCDTNATCSCTQSNAQNLQECFNCLIAEEPQLPQSNQTEVTSDVQTVISAFNGECAPLGIPTLTFPSAAVKTAVSGTAINTNADTSDGGSFPTANPTFGASTTASFNNAPTDIPADPSSIPTAASPEAPPDFPTHSIAQVTVGPSSIPTTSSASNSGGIPAGGTASKSGSLAAIGVSFSLLVASVGHAVVLNVCI